MNLNWKDWEEKNWICTFILFYTYYLAALLCCQQDESSRDRERNPSEHQSDVPSNVLFFFFISVSREELEPRPSGHQVRAGLHSNNHSHWHSHLKFPINLISNLSVFLHGSWRTPYRGTVGRNQQMDEFGWINFTRKRINKTGKKNLKVSSAHCSQNNITSLSSSTEALVCFGFFFLAAVQVEMCYSGGIGSSCVPLNRTPLLFCDSPPSPNEWLWLQRDLTSSESDHKY